MSYSFNHKSMSDSREEERSISPDEAIIIEKGEGKTPNIPDNYFLADKPTNINGKRRVRIPNSNNHDIGPGSAGFANMVMIAAIIGVIGVIVAYIIFKY